MVGNSGSAMEMGQAEDILTRLRAEAEAVATAAAARVAWYQEQLRTLDPERSPLVYDACTRNLLRWLEIRKDVVSIGFTS